MDVPTFAFVNGAAMGGGTELALHCDYRTMSTGAAAMSLPEVFLGLIPGWGGAWLLASGLVAVGTAAVAGREWLRLRTLPHWFPTAPLLVPLLLHDA